MLIFRCSLLLLLVVCSDAMALCKGETVVNLKTELGDIRIQLHCDKAPLSAGDFLTYVEKGLYDNEGFYRVVRDENDRGKPVINVIQGGLLDDKPGLSPVVHEHTGLTGLSHVRSTVSLARGDVGSGSAAYFFIVVKDAPSLDFGGKRNSDGQGFAAFGRVVAGMNVVDAIHQLSIDKGAGAGDGYTEGQILVDPVTILSATPVTN